MRLLQYLAEFNINPCPADQFSRFCDLKVENIIPVLIAVFYVVAILTSLGFIILAGVKWIMSGGDKAAVDAARNTVIGAVAGLVLIFISYFLFNFLSQVFFNKLFIDIIKFPTIPYTHV